MSTAIVTHKDCILHDTGSNHPESKERLIAINKTLKEFKSKRIKWFQGEKVESKCLLVTDFFFFSFILLISMSNQFDQPRA